VGPVNSPTRHAHNDLTYSILRQGHYSRCHNTLIKTLQSHGISDINFKYP
jgi:hypothetical protein